MTSTNRSYSCSLSAVLFVATTVGACVVGDDSADDRDVGTLEATTTQLARPNRDVSNTDPDGIWTEGSASADGDTALWNELDETTNDTSTGATFVRTANSMGPAAANRAFTVGLSSLSDPGVDTGHILRVTARKNAADGATLHLVVSLRTPSDAVVAELATPALGTSWTTYSYTLTSAQAAALTAADYSSLRVSVDADASGACSGCSRFPQITQLELQVPAASTSTGTGTTPPTSTTCSGLSGIEKKFPCSPLTAGPMPEQASKTNAWAMFTNTLYPGSDDGDGLNERFSAVANPSGSGVVIRNQNLLSDSEQHTTVGTERDLPYGSTECSAFRWLWKDSTELSQASWILVWQLQMSGSPIVAISVDQSTHDWFFKSRNGSDAGLDIRLGGVQFGQWAYFVVCTHIADAPGGWTAVWFQQGTWPDVTSPPAYKRAGHDTYQGAVGHNTIGIYAGHDGSSRSYTGYFDRYGRATTASRAVTLAGN